MMDKSPEAFRTISEVATLLETPAHVLRFWESRFPQIRPVKRAGGRRYYRPNDVALLTGIKYLLHAEGMTIRGVQKVLRDHGVRHVAGLIGAEISDLDLDAESALSAALTANFAADDAVPAAPERATTATIVALETALRRSPPAFGAQDAPRPPEGVGQIIESVDFSRVMDDTMDDTPIFPGFDDDPAVDSAPQPAETFSSIGEAFMALRALPRAALSGHVGAMAWLARARALRAKMLDNAPKDAL